MEEIKHIDVEDDVTYSDFLMHQIKQRVSIIHVAEKYGVTIQHKGRYVMIPCPDLEHKNDNECFGAIFLDMNFFMCECGVTGDVIEYTKLMELSKIMELRQ